MENETNKYDPFKQQKATDSASAAAATQNLLEKGTEAYAKAEKAVGEAYEKSSQKVKETYDKAKTYSTDHPGTTVLVALGVGVGIGLLLGANSSRHSRTGRIARPVINALSDIANEYFH
jgi:ElaB/YqjD/DUF883 family membrane-anchored ribosome-binding protein